MKHIKKQKIVSWIDRILPQIDKKPGQKRAKTWIGTLQMRNSKLLINMWKCDQFQELLGKWKLNYNEITNTLTTHQTAKIIIIKKDNIVCWQRRGAIKGLINYWWKCKLYTSESTILLLGIHPIECVNVATRRYV